MLKGDIHQAGHSFATDMIVMVGAAADDAAEGDKAVEFFWAAEREADRLGQFEAAVQGYLKAVGIDVDVRELPEARQLIERFAFTITQPARPFVTLKMAMSLDGAIATQPGRAEWLTGEPARAFVRRQRAESK